MKNLLHRASAVALALLPSPGFAQAVPGKAIIAPAGFVPAQAIYCDDGTGHAVACSFGTGGGGAVDIVVKASATDRGAIVGTTAVTLAPENAARRGWAIQVQAGSAVSCYVNGTAAATADYHSLQVGGGGYYQSPDGHVGTGALSVVCSAANTSVYMREW